MASSFLFVHSFPFQGISLMQAVLRLSYNFPFSTITSKSFVIGWPINGQFNYGVRKSIQPGTGSQFRFTQSFHYFMMQNWDIVSGWVNWFDSFFDLTVSNFRRMELLKCQTFFQGSYCTFLRNICIYHVPLYFHTWLNVPVNQFF